MMVATLTNRAVIAILVVSANQNIRSGDIVRNSARSNQEMMSSEMGSTTILRSSNFAVRMSHLGHERRFRDICGTSALPPILTVTADILNRQLRANPRLMHRSKDAQWVTYSITASTFASKLGGYVSPPHGCSLSLNQASLRLSRTAPSAMSLQPLINPRNCW